MNTIIKGGYVIDPGNQRQGYLDVHLADGKVKEVAANIRPCDGDVVEDATGLLVCPGLIDMHTHCYQYATPLGVNPDDTCLAKGNTSFVVK